MTTPAVARLRVVPAPDEVDLAGAAEAAERFLAALGISTDNEAMAETPLRMAKAYAELMSPRPSS